uniref:UBA domain-containing protein n=1 Tax=Setaria digitata TaxID=48799 RepID=A0A915PTV0_9BILA
MVNVWFLASGNDFTWRSFSIEKYVKEILDEFVSDPEQRAKSNLIFLGRVLAEDTKLCDVRDLKDQHTLHVMIRSKPVSMPKLQLDSRKLQECREKFQFLRASKRSREKVIDEMSKETFMEDLLKEFPLLKKDRVALIVAKDFILSGAMVMGKQNKEEAFLQDHPLLVDVVHHWLRGINVPPKMSHSGSSASISDNPTPASGQSGYTPIVTPQMLQEAVAQAMGNMGGGGINQGFSSSTTSSSRNSHHLHSAVSASGSTQYAFQMSQLADFGFANTEENRRILEETNGNVEQALELLIALRESVMDLGDATDS